MTLDPEPESFTVILLGDYVAETCKKSRMNDAYEHCCRGRKWIIVQEQLGKKDQEMATCEKFELRKTRKWSYEDQDLWRS